MKNRQNLLQMCSTYNLIIILIDSISVDQEHDDRDSESKNMIDLLCDVMCLKAS
jgi:hypothetical protein